MRYANCAKSAKSLQTRFSLEHFGLIEFFEDTAILMYGQRILSSSTDTIDADEIFMINEEFQQVIRNQARVSCLFRHTRAEATHRI